MSLLHYDTDQAVVIKTRSMHRSRDRILIGKSLYLFSTSNIIRRLSDKVSSSKIFDCFIIMCILLSTVTLAFESPLKNPESEKMQNLVKIDHAFTLIFCMEAALKIISVGLFANGYDSYLLNSWNILDFSIVILALVSQSVDAKLSVFKVLRVARILRPLKLI